MSRCIYITSGTDSVGAGERQYRPEGKAKALTRQTQYPGRGGVGERGLGARGKGAFSRGVLCKSRSKVQSSCGRLSEHKITTR